MNDHDFDDAVINVGFGLLEAQIQNMIDEYDMMAIAIGQIGARLMGVIEDGFDIDAEELNEENWVFVTVNVEEYRTMEDPCFRMHFRLKKQTFESLLRELAFFLIDSGKVQRIRNRLDIPLLMVLWILATPDSFRSVALRFGVRPGSVHDHYSYIIEALRNMAPRYVQWPDREEREVIKDRFFQYSGMPGIIGAIDGTFQNVTAPLIVPQRFVNRHHQYAFNTMVVCDDNLLIRDFHIGEPGSMHDSRVFRRSPLYMKLLRDENEELLCADEHLVGDGAYKVMNFMMCPFRNRLNLTEQQVQFNKTLSRCRVRIEHTFGKAFGQWRRMKMLQTSNIDLAVDHFTACYVLHNFMILNGEQLMDLDQPDQFQPVENEVEEEEELLQHAELHGLEAAAQRRGVIKRRQLVAQM